MDLKSLPEEYKQQAFERAKLSLKLKDGVLVRITDDHYEEALNITKQSFLKDEILTGSSGVVWGPDVEEYWTNILRKNWSIMVMNEANGEAMGILTMKYETVNDTYPVDKVKDPGLKHVHKFCDIGEKKGDIYKHFNVSETIHIISISVAEKCRHRGIGTKLVQVAIAMVKELKVKGGVCLKVEGSSNHSKRIFENLGFETLFDLPFDEYTDNGEQIFKNTGEHKTMKMYGMLVSC